MVTVTQTRREVTVRSARLDYVALDKRVAVLPTYDTTIPATPTDTKAPSTALMVAQLAGKETSGAAAAAVSAHDSATTPHAGKFDSAGSAAAITLTGLGGAPLAAVRHVFLPSGAMIPRTSTAPAAATVSGGTNNVVYDTYDFDSATAEYGSWVCYLEHWNSGTIKFKPVWTAGSGTGAVCWALQARAYADGAAIDQAYGTAQRSTDTLQTAGASHIGPASAAIAVAGTPANGQRLQVQIYRDVANDDLNADARLIGVWLEYQEAATVEVAWA